MKCNSIKSTKLNFKKICGIFINQMGNSAYGLINLLINLCYEFWFVLYMNPCSRNTWFVTLSSVCVEPAKILNVFYGSIGRSGAGRLIVGDPRSQTHHTR